MCSFWIRKSQLTHDLHCTCSIMVWMIHASVHCASQFFYPGDVRRAYGAMRGGSRHSSVPIGCQLPRHFDQAVGEAQTIILPVDLLHDNNYGFFLIKQQLWLHPYRYNVQPVQTGFPATASSQLAMLGPYSLSI